MRKWNDNKKISVHAISGSHVILLGFDATNEARKGLLGFTIQRTDHTEDEKSWLKGFKTFQETVHNSSSSPSFLPRSSSTSFRLFF